jgi:hypothetical protein
LPVAHVLAVWEDEAWKVLGYQEFLGHVDAVVVGRLDVVMEVVEVIVFDVLDVLVVVRSTLV